MGVLDDAVAKTTFTMSGDLVSVVTVADALEKLGSLEKLLEQRQAEYQKAVAALEDLKSQIEIASAALRDTRAQLAKDVAASRAVLADLKAEIAVSNDQLVEVAQVVPLVSVKGGP